MKMLCPGLNGYMYVNIMNRYKEKTNKNTKNNTKTIDKNKIKIR